MTMNFLVTWLIVLVSLILIATLIQRTFSHIDDDIVEKTCRQSVDFRAQTAINVGDDGGLEEVKFATLLCRTQDVKISGTKDEIKKELAELMANCWYMFREGKTNDIFATVPGLNGANQGFVCYTALIGEVELESGDTDTRIPVQEMIDFLAEENSYPEMKAGDQSYLSYIQYGGGPGRIMFYLQNDPTPTYNQGFIDQGHGYEIAYIERRGDTNDWIGPLLTAGGGSLIGLGGIAFAAPTGGFSLVVTGAAYAAAGTLAAASGLTLTYQELDKERDVASIVVLDFADKKTRREFHKQVFVGDSAGD